LRLAPYITTFEFAIAHALFALSTFAALWSGVLSLAAVSFGAAAGFGYAYVATELGVGLFVGLVLGGLIGGLFGLVTSGLLRLETHYLAMATIALVLITRVLVINLPDVTGGASGSLVPGSSSTWMLLAVLGVTCWVFARLRRSRFGIATEVVREDPDVAAALGINARAIKRIGFTLSGIVGGLGGVLFADLLRFIGPDTYYVDLAFVMLASVVLGGAYHWLGAVVGAVVFTALPEVLSEFLARGENIANGIMLLVIMIYLPRGIVDPERRRLKAASDGAGDPPRSDEQNTFAEVAR
jgi:branched-chain amino acid transport system permease protein